MVLQLHGGISGPLGSTGTGMLIRVKKSATELDRYTSACKAMALETKKGINSIGLIHRTHSAVRRRACTVHAAGFCSVVASTIPRLLRRALHTFTERPIAVTGDAIWPAPGVAALGREERTTAEDGLRGALKGDGGAKGKNMGTRT